MQHTLNGELVFKTHHNGKQPEHDEPEHDKLPEKAADTAAENDAWVQYLVRHSIFSDVQAKVLHDTLTEIQARIRNYNEESDKAFAEDVADFVMDKIGGIPNEIQALRERIAMLEGRIAAMTDLKGVPGPRGEKGSRGEPGRQGVPGSKGIDGRRGTDAAHWIAVKVDGYDLVAVMSDGRLGPRISLKSMFEAFYVQQMTQQMTVRT